MRLPAALPLLALLLSPAARAVTLDAAQAAALLHAATPAVQTALAQPQTLDAELRARSATGSAADEAWLLNLARTLATAPDTATGRAALVCLAGYEPQTRSRLLEHGREIAIVAFPINAAARAALKTWAVKAESAALASALTQGRYAAVAQTSAEAQQRAAAAATPTALAGWLADASAVAATGPPALAVLAERLAALQAYRALWAHPQAPASLAAIARLPQVLPAGSAFELLRAATQIPALASAAVLAMAQLPANATLQAQLIAGLADPALGSSYAQALAPLLADGRAQIAPAAMDGAAQANALLALYLAGDPSSRRQLAEFAADPRQTPTLRAEVTAWLR